MTTNNESNDRRHDALEDSALAPEAFAPGRCPSPACQRTELQIRTELLSERLAALEEKVPYLDEEDLVNDGELRITGRMSSAAGIVAPAIEALDRLEVARQKSATIHAAEWQQGRGNYSGDEAVLYSAALGEYIPDGMKIQVSQGNAVWGWRFGEIDGAGSVPRAFGFIDNVEGRSWVRWLAEAPLPAALTVSWMACGVSFLGEARAASLEVEAALALDAIRARTPGRSIAVDAGVEVSGAVVARSFAGDGAIKAIFCESGAHGDVQFNCSAEAGDVFSLTLADSVARSARLALILRRDGAIHVVHVADGKVCGIHRCCPADGAAAETDSVIVF